MFLNEKHEKDLKIKELEVLKSKEESVSEVKDLKIKYENIKMTHQKEYQCRKEKDAKLEQANETIQKKEKTINDLY